MPHPAGDWIFYSILGGTDDGIMQVRLPRGERESAHNLISRACPCGPEIVPIGLCPCDDPDCRTWHKRLFHRPLPVIQ